MAFIAYISAAEKDLFKAHDAKKYKYRSLIQGNMQEVLYLVPLIDGTINGYYEIEAISVKLNDKGEPRTNFQLGKYLKFGEENAIVKRDGIWILNHSARPMPLHKVERIYKEAQKNRASEQ